MKKTTSKILACLLAVVMLLTMVPFTVGAATGYEGRTLTYFDTDEGQAFSGTGISFDDDVAIGNGAGSISIKMQIKFNGAPSGKYSIVEFYQDSNNYINLYVNANNSNPRIGADIVVNGSNQWSGLMYTKTGNTAFTDGAWHSLEYTFDGDDHIMTLDSAVSTGSGAKGAFNGSRGLNFTKLTVGGSAISGDTYVGLNGAIKNLTIKNSDPVPAGIIGVYDNDDVIPAEDIEQLLNASSGAVAISYKLKEGQSGKVELLGLGENVFSIDPGKETISLNDTVIGTWPVPDGGTGRMTDTTQWHSIFIVLNEFADVYFDGTWINQFELDGLIDSGDAESFIGKNVANVTLYRGDILENHITEYAGQTGSNILASKYADVIANRGYFYDFDRQALMQIDDEKSAYYRIPGMVQAGDVTIASVDERKGTASDYGAIDLQVRRSFDNGKTWGEPVTVSEFGAPAGAGLAGQRPLHIDSGLAYDKTNDVVYLVMDMFPESTAAMNMSIIQDGSGFFTATLEDGSTVRMQALNTERNGGTRYGLIQDTSLENGDSDGTAKVYEPTTVNGQTVYVESKTYFVDDYSYGSLKKDPNGEGNFTEDAGNIFVYSTGNAGELTVTCTMYVWLYKSYDKGETWTNPINISGFEGAKQDWMRFCGTAPGSGIVIEGGEHDGRIVFPCYFTNNASSGLASQSAAVFYSDDQGKTWSIGKSVNEIRLNANDENAIKTFQNGNQTTENSVVQVNADGKLRIYCRNTGGYGKVVTAVSNDGGETWQAPDGAISGANGNSNTFPTSCYEYDITEVYCQLAAITYHDPITDKYYVVISNPLGQNGSGRYNMGIHVREIDYTTGEYAQGSSWITTQIGDTSEAYSALTQLADGNIGLFWEMSRVNASYDMPFQRFTIDYLLSNELFYPTETMSVTGEVIQGESGSNAATDAGDTLIITVNTHDPVYILGTPKLKLNIGGTVSGNALGRTITGGTEKYASYIGGSGTSAIKFAYVIEADDDGVIAAWDEFNISNGLGDVYADGVINSLDATYILQQAAGIIELDSTAFANADVNGDGSVTSLDATLVLQYAAGIIKEFSGASGVAENALGAAFKTVSPRYTIVGNTGFDPKDASRDIPYGQTTAQAGSAQSSEGAENAVDGDESTLWHSSWTGTDRDALWISLSFAETTVDGLRYLPRTSGTNGMITKYAIDVIGADGQWTEVATGSWAGSSGWKIASFAPVTTTGVRLRAVESMSDSAQYVFASATEIRVTKAN